MMRVCPPVGSGRQRSSCAPPPAPPAPVPEPIPGTQPNAQAQGAMADQEQEQTQLAYVHAAAWKAEQRGDLDAHFDANTGLGSTRRPRSHRLDSRLAAVVTMIAAWVVVTDRPSKGATGGAANEAGAEYRRAVAAFFVAHGLRGQAAPLDLPPHLAIVRSVRLEVDDEPDDIEVGLVPPYRALVQAKTRLTRGSFRSAAAQVLKAVRRPGFDPDVDRLVIISAYMPGWAKTLSSVLRAERGKVRGRRTREEQASIEILHEGLGDATPRERELARRATELVWLVVGEEGDLHSQNALLLLDGNVVPTGEGHDAWRELIRIAGRFARSRAGGDMDVWRNELRYGRIELLTGANDYLPEDPAADSIGYESIEFVNRETELRALDELAATIGEGGERPIVALISGMPGVGKTSIGRHWGKLNEDRFTDGELAVDLSKFRSRAQVPPTSTMPPHLAATVASDSREALGVDLGGVLGTFLESLGVKSFGLPSGLREREELFRSLTMSRKLLIRVDDVFYPAEVSSLLPGGSESMVIATANRNVEALRDHAAALVELNPLDDEAALELLSVVVGDRERIQAEQSLVDRLVEICDGLPIAISVSGRWIAADRRRTVSKLVGRLTDEARRPRALAVPGDVSLDRVFDLAYDDLAPYPALVYRRIGVFPGNDVDPGATAILADITVSEALAALESLRGRYLMERLPGPRFQMHSRIREHSRKSALEFDALDTREQALRRLVDWYRAAARRADRALNEDRLRIATNDQAAVRALPSLASGEEALGWFEAEDANVIAVLSAANLRSWDDDVWTIVEALWNFYYTRRPFSDWKEAHRLGIASAERCGNLAALAQMHKQASRLYAELGQFDDARRHLRKAEDTVKASGNEPLTASIVEFTGSFLMDIGDHTGALKKFRTARKMFGQLGIPRGVAIQDLLIGTALIKLGGHKKALRPLRESLRFMREISDYMLEARTLLQMGEALRGTGRIEEAEEAANAALSVTVRLNFPIERAEAYEVLARVAQSTTDSEETVARWRKAHELYSNLGHPRAADVASILVRLEQGLRPTG